MEIKVNDAQWHGLTQPEKDTLTQIVSGHFKGASIVPDSATPAVDLGEITTQGFHGLSNPFCKTACDIAQAAAGAACVSVGGPIAVAVCIAVAQAAGNTCRNSC